MHADADREGVRLAELVAALSLGIDLGFDQPMEHVLRQCLIALRLAEQVGVDEHTRTAVYYTALLNNVGCHSDAHEQAKWFGDDIGLKADKYAYGVHGLAGAVAGIRRFGSGADGMAQRFRVGLEFAVSGYRDVSGMITQHSKMARKLGADLGLPVPVLDALDASYEQWDGKGWPGELKGEDVPIAARLAVIGEFTEVALRVGGVDAAIKMVREQRGKQFDPASRGCVRDPRRDPPGRARHHRHLGCRDRRRTRTRGHPLGRPVRRRLAGDRRLHRPEVTLLARPRPRGRRPRRGRRDQARDVGCRGTHGSPGGLVHSFGKLGVSNAILDKPTPLGAGERERVRMAPYLTERMLRQSPVLAALGAIAVQHAERLDGSGYPKGLSGTAISRPARVLAAADAYQSMREPRAYREAFPPKQAAAELRDLVKVGRLESDAVEAVLGAAGHRVPRRRTGPAGLTAREIDVLRLLARGLTNKEIAERLVISRKTVANHVEHIYTKIDVSTRTAAGLFATQHGLLGDEEPVSV